MTPAEAAAVLGVRPGATADQVSAAYRAKARQSHPDRFVGESDQRSAEAAGEFVRIAEARKTLLAGAPTETRTADAGRLPFTDSTPRIYLTRTNWRMVWVWVGVSAVAIFIATFGDVPRFTVFEPIVRYSVLIGSMIAYAATGRTVWLVIAAVALAATALIAIFFTTFGALLGLFLLSAPLIGLTMMGLSRAPRSLG